MNIGNTIRLAQQLNEHKPRKGCGAELAGWASGVNAVVKVCERFVPDFDRLDFLKLADCPEHW